MLSHSFEPPKVLHIELTEENKFDFSVKPKVEISYEISSSKPAKRVGHIYFFLTFLWRYYIEDPTGKNNAVVIVEHRVHIKCRDCTKDLSLFTKLISDSLSAVEFEIGVMKEFYTIEEVKIDNPPGKLSTEYPALELPETVLDVVAGQYD